MRGFFNFLAWVAVVLGVVGGAAYWLLVDVWTVPADDPLLDASVEPTLRGGDLLLILRRRSVDRGALVRCADPQNPGRFVVGRAMARGGEQIDISGGFVSVDGRHTPSPRGCDNGTWNVYDPTSNENVQLGCAVEEYAGRDYDALRSTGQPEPSTHLTVTARKWFLVSDDRAVHLDSREFGAIDPDTCQRIVLRVVGAGGLADADSRFTFVW